MSSPFGPGACQRRVALTASGRPSSFHRSPSYERMRPGSRNHAKGRDAASPATVLTLRQAAISVDETGFACPSLCEARPAQSGLATGGAAYADERAAGPRLAARSGADGPRSPAETGGLGPTSRLL